MTLIRFPLSSPAGSGWECGRRLNYEVCKWLNAALIRTNQSISLRLPTPTGVLRWSDHSSGPNPWLKISISFISNTFSFIAGIQLFFFFQFSLHSFLHSVLAVHFRVAVFEVLRVVAKKTKPLPYVTCRTWLPSFIYARLKYGASLKKYGIGEWRSN